MTKKTLPRWTRMAITGLIVLPIPMTAGAFAFAQAGSASDKVATVPADYLKANAAATG